MQKAGAVELIATGLHRLDKANTQPSLSGIGSPTACWIEGPKPVMTPFYFARAEPVITGGSTSAVSERTDIGAKTVS